MNSEVSETIYNFTVVKIYISRQKYLLKDLISKKLVKIDALSVRRRVRCSGTSEIYATKVV